MKNLTILIVIILTISTNILAQGVGVNATGANADASAMLDVSSTTKGFLPPRMTTAQKTAISSPATGLLVYQTDGTPGLYYYNGSSWITFATGTHYIGESYGGGTVYWVDATGQHGLIVAPADLSGIHTWYAGSYTTTQARGNGIGAGKTNSAIIISNQGVGDGRSYAALACAALVVTSGGVDYGDWYLPSKYELDLLYNQKTTIGFVAGGSSYYNSSTEVSSTQYLYVYFANGSSGNAGKTAEGPTRAIRSF